MRNFITQVYVYYNAHTIQTLTVQRIYDIILLILRAVGLILTQNHNRLCYTPQNEQIKINSKTSGQLHWKWTLVFKIEIKIDTQWFIHVHAISPVCDTDRLKCCQSYILVAKRAGSYLTSVLHYFVKFEWQNIVVIPIRKQTKKKQKTNFI